MSEKETQNPFQQVQNQPQQKLESVEKKTGLEIPVESVKLPSKGILYSSDNPLFNEDQVEIRCMTAREEDILTSTALIKNGTVMSKLMESCLMNKTIDPDSLLTGDRNAILIAIRITGYGPDYTVKVDCPDCKEEFEKDFTLNKLKIKPLGAQPLQSNLNLFSFMLPMCKKEVQFKLLTGADEAEITKINERKKKLGSQIDNSVTLRLMQAIVSIDGETDKQKLSYIINNLRAGDARALRKYIADISPSVDMKQWTKCTKCGEEVEVDIPLGLSFFWPDIG